MIFVYVPYHRFDLFALIQEKGVSSSIKTWSVWVCRNPTFLPHTTEPPQKPKVSLGEGPNHHHHPTNFHKIIEVCTPTAGPLDLF